MSEDLSISDRLRVIYRVAAFRPAITVGILVFSLVAAVLEGIGLSFLLPIIELARTGPDAVGGEGAIQIFIDVYDFVGLPFTLETLILGVSLVMIVRYVSSFSVSWLRGALEARYVRHLQVESFDNAIGAEISYFDQQGSDEILNAIVTQTRYAGQVIRRATTIVEQSLIGLVYLAIALYLAPILTVAAAVLLGGLTWFLRSVVESGFAVGDRKADANEMIQEKAQAGMQGIREVKLFGLKDELRPQFRSAVDKLAAATTKIRRNKSALDNMYQLATALTVFALIYAAIAVASLSLAGLGIFLFAIFRLSPRVSNLNKQLYSLEGDLPHVLRTQAFIRELNSRQEPTTWQREAPEKVRRLNFEDVTFRYPTGEEVFQNLSFEVERGEFVAFVGPSGAGKSTVPALLARMYEISSGSICANGRSIYSFPIGAWREKLSIVRQDPFVFNESVRWNVAVGNRSATDDEIETACEIARVTEFLDDLPNGYDTVLGDEGIRLSGGQKQRIAIARALLKDAEVLILDEATSDLDANLEEQVHTSIEHMEREMIIIVIAHRLSTVINADSIYVFEDGQIVESGTHKELLENESTYADLYKTQTSDLESVSEVPSPEASDG